MMRYLLLSILLYLSTSLYSQSTWQVTKVVDGDTFYAVAEGTKAKFRLIGIDTPEFSIFGKPEEPYAHEATDFLKSLIEYQEVILKEDVQPLDRYKRQLVHVYLKDDTFVNAELVKAGWATTMTIPPNVSYAELFSKLQTDARKTRLGIWQDTVSN